MLITVYIIIDVVLIGVAVVVCCIVVYFVFISVVIVLFLSLSSVFLLAISLIYANFMRACAIVVNKLVDWQQNFRSVYSIM